MRREGSARTSSVQAEQLPHILVVDDEKQVLLALEDLLEGHFRVTATDQPARALRLAEEDPSISVVMSDQRMPQMTGDELLARLRKSTDATRILCTGFADINAVVRSVNEGKIFAYVTKPWDGVDLRLKMQHAADYYRLNHELAYEKQLLGDLMRSMPDAIFFKDTQHRYIRVNDAFLDVFGVLSMPEVLGKRLTDLASGQLNGARIEEAERKLLADGMPRRDLLECPMADGRMRWLSTTRAAVRGPDGKIIGLIGISQDITDSIRTQDALRASEERLRLAFLAANAGLFDWNLLTGETHYSATTAGIQTLGHTAGEDFAALEARIHPEDVPRLRAALNAHFEQKVPLKSLELRIRNEDDDYRWYEIDAQAAFNEAARPVRLVGAIVDVTERRERAQRLDRLDHFTRHDELTGLPNRTLFSSELSRQLESCRTHAQRLALIAVDIVRFRHFNETLGRRGGDELLREVARRLGAAVRPKDLLVRFDSNAFMIIMSGVSHETDAAQWFQEAAVPALAEPITIQGTELRLSTKAGIALFPSDGDSEDALIANAEAALKQAKHSAQPFMFYAPSMNSRVSERLRLEGKLRRALLNDEFLLYYQPKIELKSGAMQGVEALIRWRDPEVGLVPPGSFIPILEETELILQVGQWVIERAARQYTEWLALGGDVPRIAVNVSALQLAQRDFIASLDAVLGRYPLAAKGLDLELTESVLMDDLSGNIDKLRAAKERGLQVAIDDFGTGYSSLGYLSRLPLDALKVDRSFITNMADDPQQISIVTAIISLAHAIDLKVIAEGVETATQAQLLRLLRCDQIQGYLIARPQPAGDVTALLGRQFEIPKG